MPRAAGITGETRPTGAAWAGGGALTGSGAGPGRGPPTLPGVRRLTGWTELGTTVRTAAGGGVEAAGAAGAAAGSDGFSSGFSLPGAPGLPLNQLESEKAIRVSVELMNT